MRERSRPRTRTMSASPAVSSKGSAPSSGRMRRAVANVLTDGSVVGRRSGTFTAGQREAWDLFIAGYRVGLTALKDGTGPKAVYNAALAEVRRRAPSLTTPQGRRAADTILGPNGIEAWQLHGVGLDDAEGLPEALRSGMAVAYELMFTVDGDGFYLEDMILVTRDGYELLTPGLPYTAAEIETAMSASRAARGR